MRRRTVMLMCIHLKTLYSRFGFHLNKIIHTIIIKIKPTLISSYGYSWSCAWTFQACPSSFCSSACFLTNRSRQTLPAYPYVAGSSYTPQCQQSLYLRRCTLCNLCSRLQRSAFTKYVTGGRNGDRSLRCSIFYHSTFLNQGWYLTY